MATPLRISLAYTDPATGESATLVNNLPLGTSHGVLAIGVDGHDIGDLRVMHDQDGRPTLALGQFDRRIQQWVAHPHITRRGSWVEHDERGFHPVFDGRRFGGLVYATEEQAQIAAAAIEAAKS